MQDMTAFGMKECLSLHSLGSTFSTKKEIVVKEMKKSLFIPLK